MEIGEFLWARVDEDEKVARGPLCLNCKIPIVPLRNAFGITDYTHDSWDGGQRGWQGRRCPGAMTGAEAVHDPARWLAEVALKRGILTLHRSGGTYSTGTGPGSVHHFCLTCGSGEAYEYPAEWPCPTLRLLVLPYTTHPDCLPEWVPEP